MMAGVDGGDRDELEQLGEFVARLETALQLISLALARVQGQIDTLIAATERNAGN